MRKILSIILMAAMLSSCGSLKRVTKSDVKTTTKETEKTEKVSDSSRIVEISRGIKDNVSLSLRTNNKIVDSIIKSRLKDFSAGKTSGSNSYSAFFDYDKMSLDLESIIGETKNEEISTNKDEKTETSFTSEMDSYFTDKMTKIPFWIWIAIGLYFLPKILAGVSAIINPVGSVLSKISNLKNKNS
jgi:hypothetical protein